MATFQLIVKAYKQILHAPLLHFILFLVPSIQTQDYFGL